ncbi:MAG: hypothetical protein AAFV62_05485, partial [Pseudomonadota bacterium]
MGETPPTSAEEADDLFGIRPITPWGPVAAETRAFNKAARDLLADVPPPEATDIPAIRQLRAEGPPSAVDMEVHPLRRPRPALW